MSLISLPKASTVVMDGTAQLSKLYLETECWFCDYKEIRIEKGTSSLT